MEYIVKVKDTAAAHNAALGKRANDPAIGKFLQGRGIAEIQKNIDVGGRPTFKQLKRRRYKKLGAVGLGRTGTGLGPVGILYWTGQLFRDIGMGSHHEYSGGRWTITLVGGKGPSKKYYAYQHALRPFHLIPPEQRKDILGKVDDYLMRGKPLW